MPEENTMRVMTQDTYGAPDVLRLDRRPIPLPQPTEIRVRVQSAGVNPVDWKTRAGGGVSGLLGRPPFVLGWDVAGVVDALGGGVTRFALGDRVFGMPKFPHEGAAYAEFVTAPSRHFALMPAALSMTDAAALPLAALTAWQALVDTAKVQPGQRVLIHAAAGGVGHLAVQIAKSQGAHVIGTARTAKHAELLRLGIDEAFDYSLAPFEESIKEIDVVLDLVGGSYGVRSLSTLRDGGLLIAVPGGVSDELSSAAAAQHRALRVSGILVEPDHAALERIAELVAAKRLVVAVSSIFPLEGAAQAHETGEAGRTFGKNVLTVAA